MALEGTLTVLLVHAPHPRRVIESTLHMPAGSTLADALQQAGLDIPQADADGRFPGLSIWSRRVDPTHVLREGDRIEVTRDLRVDPKIARRERFARQGSRTTGLFSQKRPGGKAGY